MSWLCLFPAFKQWCKSVCYDTDTCTVICRSIVFYLERKCYHLWLAPSFVPIPSIYLSPPHTASNDSWVNRQADAITMFLVAIASASQWGWVAVVAHGWSLPAGGVGRHGALLLLALQRPPLEPGLISINHTTSNRFSMAKQAHSQGVAV